MMLKGTTIKTARSCLQKETVSTGRTLTILLMLQLVQEFIIIFVLFFIKADIIK